MQTIGVLFGGVSSESEISVITTCAVFRYLKQLSDYTIIPIYIDKSGAWYHLPDFDGNISHFMKYKIGESSPLMVKPGIEKGLQIIERKGWTSSDKEIVVDILFPILHGIGGEDGSVQGLAQMAGIPVVGPDLFTASWTMDKILTKIMLRSHNFPVSDYRVLEKNNYNASQISSLTDALGQRVIVKPFNGGSSIGVTKCESEEHLQQAIELAFTFGEKIVVEPFLGGRKEVCCAVASIDGKTTATLIEDPGINGDVFSFDDKYNAQGGAFTGSARVSHIPAQIDQHIADAIRRDGEKIFDTFMMSGTPRIDWLVNESTGERVIIEVNAIPGNLASHIWMASGVPTSKLLQSLINDAKVHMNSNFETGKQYTTNILADYAKLGGGKIGGKIGK